jgi:CheY-like chemotaxis protein
MAANSTLLCIHRDPDQLALLRENGYELLTATSGSEGLQLLQSRSIDAIVLEYHLGLMDGAVVAAVIKKAKPQLPIVMLADHLDLPDGALKSVDALVIKSDGAHFLWATVHFVLNVKPTQRRDGTLKAQRAAQLRRTGRSREDGKEQKAEVVEQDNDPIRAIYGKHMMSHNILSGKATTPRSADAFPKAVSEAGQQAKLAEAKEDKK